MCGSRSQVCLFLYVIYVIYNPKYECLSLVVTPHNRANYIRMLMMTASTRPDKHCLYVRCFCVSGLEKVFNKGRQIIWSGSTHIKLQCLTSLFGTFILGEVQQTVGFDNE